MDPYATPPPIPKQRTGYHKAALAGLIAPLIVLVLALVTHSLGKGANQLVLVAAGLLSFILIGAGLVCSVIALTGIRSSGRGGLLGPGICGVLFNGLFVVVFGFGFIHGFTKALTNRQAMQQMLATTHEMNQKAGDDFNPTNGINGQAELNRLDQMRNRLNALTNQLTGNDAEMMGALNTCLAKWEVAEKQFYAATAAFQKADVLNFNTLDSLSQLAEREQAVQTFLDANQQFRTVLLNQEQDLKTELSARNVSSQNIDQMMTGFRMTHEPMLACVTQIRDCDKIVGEDCLQLLALAGKQWGKWTADPVKKILFSDDSIQVSAKMLVEDINVQARQELKLQREVIQIQRSANAQGR